MCFHVHSRFCDRSCHSERSGRCIKMSSLLTRGCAGRTCALPQQLCVSLSWGAGGLGGRPSPWQRQAMSTSQKAPPPLFLSPPAFMPSQAVPPLSCTAVRQQTKQDAVILVICELHLLPPLLTRTWPFIFYRGYLDLERLLLLLFLFFVAGYAQWFFFLAVHGEARIFFL